MNIAAIMPCRGRFDQTIANADRLQKTAGADATWIAVGGSDEGDTLQTLRLHGWQIAGAQTPRLTYWQALALATERTTATHLIGLANDLIPGQHWLRRAVDAYQSEFGAMPGLLGFNGDSHGVEHSCHFLIARQLLDRYGGWPAHYDHNFGDTELCQRAIADRCYAKAAWALLFHDHPYFGGDDDAVYAEGRAQVTKDERLFQQRKAMGWPHVGATE